MHENKGTKGLNNLNSDTENIEYLNRQIIRYQEKLQKTETLLSVTRKISGITDLSEILWTLIDITSQELNAERGSLFLNDAETGELYSRVAQGEMTREIRILNTNGIAGSIFLSGKGEIVHSPYDDKRFFSKIDEQTGFVTKNIVCAPIRAVTNEVIGVIQICRK